MKNILYLHGSNQMDQGVQATLNDYFKLNGIKVHQKNRIYDEVEIKVHWTERLINQVLKQALPGDCIITYDCSDLACSTSQVLEILSRADQLRVDVIFVKYSVAMKNQTGLVETQEILTLIGKIESNFISNRTAIALARRRAAGLPLGRPKGMGNKSLKLDKHKDDIAKYLKLGISKASIAKLVDCHPQTLYDWLDRQESRMAKINQNAKERPGDE